MSVRTPSLLISASGYSLSACLSRSLFFEEISPFKGEAKKLGTRKSENKNTRTLGVLQLHLLPSIENWSLETLNGCF